LLVRIVGQAPLAATVYELERLRCNACGQIFTAQEPEGVGAEKYDETAAAMIAQMKYGSGVPFYRLEQMEELMGIPLPAATQWEIVEEAAEVMKPARDELIRQRQRRAKFCTTTTRACGFCAWHEDHPTIALVCSQAISSQSPPPLTGSRSTLRGDSMRARIWPTC
jgi:hypothetical protein